MGVVWEGRKPLLPCSRQRKRGVARLRLPFHAPCRRGGCRFIGDEWLPHARFCIAEDRQATPAASSRWPTVTSARPRRAVSAGFARRSRCARVASRTSCCFAAIANRSSTYIWANITCCKVNIVLTAFVVGRSGKPTPPATFVVSPAASCGGRQGFSSL